MIASYMLKLFLDQRNKQKMVRQQHWLNKRKIIHYSRSYVDISDIRG